MERTSCAGDIAEMRDESVRNGPFARSSPAVFFRVGHLTLNLRPNSPKINAISCCVVLCLVLYCGMTTTENGYLTPEQAANLMGVHVETIRRLCREGKIPHTKVGRQIRISREALTETTPKQ